MLQTTAMMPAASPFAGPPPPMPIMVHPGLSALSSRRRGTTIKVRRGPTGSLATLAAWIESVPMPSIPDSAWTFIGRAWFFVAGTTMGILVALALIASSPTKAKVARQRNAVATQANARILVIQRPPMAAERTIGELAQNDVDEVAPAPPPLPAPVRRPITVARRPAAAPANGGGNILTAGL
jgi:hypothetical protein